MNEKQDIISTLRATGREGIENVIEWLQESDFFTAPASTNFHGNYPGGLAEHSMNVYETALALRDTMAEVAPEKMETLSDANIAIAALLHDVCKANIYKPIQKKKQNAMGIWVPYDTYTVDYSELPVGHGEKSVIILLRLGLKMTDSEIMAIRWHMSAWDLAFQSAEMKNNIGLAKDKCPLLAIVQAADGLAASLLEEAR